MKRIKAIITKYRNVEFRSRLEARWAVWFDAMEIPWTYEPEGFMVDGETYLPDFYTTAINGGVYIEIKPKGISGKEKEKAFRMVDAFDSRLLLIIGNPMFEEYSCNLPDYGCGGSPFVFADCRRCNGLCECAINDSGWGDIGRHTCGDHDRAPLVAGPRIMAAYARAMNCKFGERTNRIGTRPNDGPTLTEMMQNAVRATGQK